MNFLKRAEDLNMSSEVTYAEVRFKNESKSSGSQSEPPEGKKRFLVVRVNDEMKDEETIL